MDRRGQKDAHAALCALYTKIIKANITEDKYEIVNLHNDIEENDYFDRLSKWLSEFAQNGNVHPEDLEIYIAHTNILYLRDYFLRKKKSMSIIYRRKSSGDEGFKRFMLEIISANDYTDENQKLFMYLKKIDK